MPATKTRRTDWTIPQWRDFTARCRDARGRTTDLVRNFPETRGLTPALIRQFIKADHALHTAMTGLESLVILHHPAMYGRSIEFVHGKDLGFWGDCQGKVAKDAPDLSRDQWLSLAYRVRQIRCDVSALGLELRGIRGGTKRVQNRFLEACMLGRARSMMEEIAIRQHPDWQVIPGVFFGTSDNQPIPWPNWPPSAT